MCCERGAGNPAHLRSPFREAHRMTSCFDRNWLLTVGLAALIAGCGSGSPDDGSGTGGATGLGGTTSTGGASATGGGNATGGVTGTGGGPSTGGSTGSGGATGARGGPP